MMCGVIAVRLTRALGFTIAEIGNWEGDRGFLRKKRGSNDENEDKRNSEKENRTVVGSAHISRTDLSSRQSRDSFLRFRAGWSARSRMDSTLVPY